MNITILGAGYVGLVTGTCLAEVGNQVLCVERDATKVEKLEAGTPGFYEPGLASLMQTNIASGRLRFATDSMTGTHHADVFFIAVNTPMSADGAADIRDVITAAENVALHLQEGFQIVVIKSTVPPGSVKLIHQRMQAVLARRDVSVELAVASNPEFLREGSAIQDCMRPDRIILGCETPRAITLLRELYHPFNHNHDRVIEMNVAAAEFTKYVTNAMLAVRISTMNEFANLAESLGVDIEEVRMAVSTDHRIGHQYLYPGCGYGGSCLPKDVAAMLHIARRLGHDALLLQAVKQVNDKQRVRLLDKIDACFPDGVSRLRFAVWGLAFKPGTDDMREAPSQDVLEGLWQRGATVIANDPATTGMAAWSSRDNFQYCHDPYQTLSGADALIILTEWQQYRSPDFSRVKELLRRPVIFDGRNLYDPNSLAAIGIHYYAIGRGSSPVAHG